MRYIVFEVPFLLKKAISTEFRLIAFIIAVFRRLAGKDVYVYDIEDGELIINWGSAHLGQDMNNLKILAVRELIITRPGAVDATNMGIAYRVF